KNRFLPSRLCQEKNTLLLINFSFIFDELIASKLVAEALGEQPFWNQACSLKVYENQFPRTP
ncbi:hypothetical protein JWJ90_17325, partial [Desulfobulbus rhabdoformis]|uniref:hypothetical protein n=1 Tax=Desulfobulbus rhabdoformis TaxID=34032 RepID=UPI001964E754